MVSEKASRFVYKYLACIFLVESIILLLGRKANFYVFYKYFKAPENYEIRISTKKNILERIKRENPERKTQ